MWGFLSAASIALLGYMLWDQRRRNTVPEALRMDGITPSCGCVFCDLDLEPHKTANGKWVHADKELSRVAECTNPTRT